MERKDSKDIEMMLRIEKEQSSKLKEENKKLKIDNNKKTERIKDLEENIENLKSQIKSLKLKYKNSEKNLNEHIKLNETPKEYDFNKLQEEKINYELKFINLTEKNDKIYSEFITQQNLQKKILKVKKETQETLNILYEQKEVEPKFFDNFDLEINIVKIESLNYEIIHLSDLIKNNKKLKNKLELSIRKFQNIFTNLNQDNQDFQNIENILNELKNKLIEFENDSKCFENNLNEIKSIQNNLKETLSNINKIVQDFLVELNEKVKKENLNSTPNNNDDDNLLSNKLLHRSRIYNFYYNDKFQKKKSFEEYFDEKNENFDKIENININLFKEPELLKLNWIEKYTITKNFDHEFEVKCILMGVGLKRNQVFNHWHYTFDSDENIKIIKTEVDGVDTPINFYSNTLKFNIYIRNGEKMQIYFKYKINEHENNIYYKKLYIGLPNILAGQKAKYFFKLDDNYEVINFKENFLKKLNNNEYYFFGMVPDEGIYTSCIVSLKEAKWKLNLKLIITNENGEFIDNSYVKIIKKFIGGNNKILDFKVESSNSSKIDNKYIFLNDDKFKVNFYNINLNIAYFNQIVTLKNNVNNEWICNLKPIIPVDEIKNKKIFSSLINEILEQDKTNTPIYIKIANWVYSNIKYTLSYAGKTLTAIQILDSKKGVCEHKTILYNALLNSMDIPALYVGGFVLEEGKNDIEEGHAWSIVNIKNKWIPIDVTWGIFSGKLPVSHMFENYGKTYLLYSINLSNADKKIKLNYSFMNN